MPGLGYMLFAQNTSIWPNPKHWLRKLHQQAQAQFYNKYSDSHRVGPGPNVFNGYSECVAIAVS